MGKAWDSISKLANKKKGSDRGGWRQPPKLGMGLGWPAHSILIRGIQIPYGVQTGTARVRFRDPHFCNTVSSHREVDDTWQLNYKAP